MNFKRSDNKYYDSFDKEKVRISNKGFKEKKDRIKRKREKW